MSIPTVVYRSTDPAQMKAWEESREPLWEKYQAECDALQKELGHPLIQNINWHGQAIVGYQAKTWDEKPLPGFRRDTKTDHMMPAKRTELGKQMAKRLNSIEFRLAPMPGLPTVVMGDGYMGPFRLENFDGDYFAWLGFHADERALREVDSALWVAAKMSEFYAAKEAAEATA